MSDKIKVDFHGGTKISASVGKWDIITDQPVKDGGRDSAANPFQLFLASLATCAGYYAQAFCARRKISTQGLGLSMNYNWDKKEKRISRIDFEIDLPQGFPEKYRSALIRAVDACTVKKHLLDPPEIMINIKGSSG